MTAKKKAQRTDWKEEHRLAIVDRNNYSAKCSRLEDELEVSHQRHDEQKRANVRLRNEAEDVGRGVLAVSRIAHEILTAPEHTHTDGETTTYGREVLLGRLIEKLLQIPQPMPF